MKIINKNAFIIGKPGQVSMKKIDEIPTPNIVPSLSKRNSTPFTNVWMRHKGAELK